VQLMLGDSFTTPQIELVKIRGRKDNNCLLSGLYKFFSSLPVRLWNCSRGGQYESWRKFALSWWFNCRGRSIGVTLTEF
jgi:hypothetical protein